MQLGRELFLNAYNGGGWERNVLCFDQSKFRSITAPIPGKDMKLELSVFPWCGQFSLLTSNYSPHSSNQTVTQTFLNIKDTCFVQTEDLSLSETLHFG